MEPRDDSEWQNQWSQVLWHICVLGYVGEGFVRIVASKTWGSGQWFFTLGIRTISKKEIIYILTTSIIVPIGKEKKREKEKKRSISFTQIVYNSKTSTVPSWGRWLNLLTFMISLPSTYSTLCYNRPSPISMTRFSQSVLAQQIHLSMNPRERCFQISLCLARRASPSAEAYVTYTVASHGAWAVAIRYFCTSEVLTLRSPALVWATRSYHNIIEGFLRPAHHIPEPSYTFLWLKSCPSSSPSPPKLSLLS